MKTLLSLSLAAVLAFAPIVVFAANENAGHTMSGSGMNSQEMSDGVVKKVDIQASKITIQHGPLENLKMPAMTMVFKAKDATILSGIKAGDSVRFVAESLPDGLTVTSIEKN